MKGLSRILLTIGLFLLLIAGGVGVAVVLVKTKPNPKKSEQEPQARSVEVQQVREMLQQIRVHANGTVIAAQEIVLQPEVTGRIVWKSPELVPGGRLKKGTLLLRIDARDYAANVQQQRAQLEQSRLALERERGRRVIARREWDLFGDAGVRQDAPDAAGQSLALREPHLRSAKASLQASKSGLQKSQLALSRTQIVAPFNAFVQDESADVGQLVSPNAQLGRLVGTDSFWVQVSVPVDRLPWIKIPGLNAKQGSSVKVIQQVGEGRVEREGRVIRLYGDLDPAGRMARVLVEVLDPMPSDKSLEGKGKDTPEGATDPSSMNLPLLLGAYVRLSIEAGELKGVFEVPRVAVREDDVVFVADSENKLRIKRPTIVWRRTETVLVRGELKSGDRVITSRLTTPLEGMDIRVSTAPTGSAAVKGKSP